jgi:hypothetical protein
LFGLDAPEGRATTLVIDTRLNSFYFGQEGLVLIPIEHLSEEGIGIEFQRVLAENTVLDQEWIDFFNRSFALYWKRSLRLHAQAPDCWMPPRVQHVCIITEREKVNPFAQLFHRSSWSIEACDFRKESSSIEYATFQFFQAERLGLLRQILPSLVSNLSYFVTLSSAQLRYFYDGCQVSQRGDAAGFRALAEATKWISKCYHQRLRVPNLHLSGYIVIPGGLIMPSTEQGKLAALQQSWQEASKSVIDAHYDSHAKPSPSKGRAICDWLAEFRPPLLVVGKEGRTLWEPESPETFADLLIHLERVTEEAEGRVIDDLKVVAHHSQRFLASLRDLGGLVDPPHYITPGGLSYIHPKKKLVAYSIDDERNHLRLVEPSPPFERLLLGARTMHEWGHLAAESGWIGVMEETGGRYEELRAELAKLMEAFYLEASGPVRAATAAEFEHLRATSKTGSPGESLVKKMIVRSEDFQANLLAKRYLSTAEMETYIRNNVYSLATESETNGVYARLLRYAYQYQYLRLSLVADPVAFFVKSSWFAEQYLQTGVVSEGQMEQLLNLVGEICDCYVIDESKFDFSMLEPSEYRVF